MSQKHISKTKNKEQVISQINLVQDLLFHYGHLALNVNENPNTI